MRVASNRIGYKKQGRKIPNIRKLKLEEKKWMEILSDKKLKLHTRKPGDGRAKETESFLIAA